MNCFMTRNAKPNNVPVVLPIVSVVVVSLYILATSTLAAFFRLYHSAVPERLLQGVSGSYFLPVVRIVGIFLFSLSYPFAISFGKQSFESGVFFLICGFSFFWKLLGPRRRLFFEMLIENWVGILCPLTLLLGRLVRFCSHCNVAFRLFSLNSGSPFALRFRFGHGVIISRIPVRGLAP